MRVHAPHDELEKLPSAVGRDGITLLSVYITTRWSFRCMRGRIAFTDNDCMKDDTPLKQHTSKKKHEV